MRIAISGASGYIGQHLSSFLEGKGYDVIPLGRDLFKEDCFDELCRCVESCEVVINLAGASINKRWTEAYKQESVSEVDKGFVERFREDRKSVV